MHPLLNDMSHLSDAEVENKILDLNRKYWATNNISVRDQISLVIDSYKLEQESRRTRQKLEQENQDLGNNSLDNLIKVS